MVVVTGHLEDRALGEQPSRDSDVDVLALVDDASWDDRMLVRTMLYEAAQALDLEALPWSFSLHVHTPTWHLVGGTTVCSSRLSAPAKRTARGSR